MSTKNSSDFASEGSISVTKSKGLTVVGIHDKHGKVSNNEVSIGKKLRLYAALNIFHTLAPDVSGRGYLNTVY